jgi:hypothetical protein
MVELWYRSPADEKRSFGPYAVALGLGVVAYAAVCAPSYNRQLWPPPDRIVEAWPWLWVFGIPIFTLLFPSGGRSRITLLLYALATAGCDAMTLPFFNMNPHSNPDLADAMGNLILFTLPIHLALTPILAGLCRLTFRLLGIAASDQVLVQSPGLWAGRAAILCGTIALAAAFPICYRHWMMNRDAAIGASIADGDWTNRKAGIFRNPNEAYHAVGDLEFCSEFDPGTGFPLRESWSALYEPGYNAEVRRLASVRGTPSWADFSRFPADADMIAFLSATAMTRITSLPYSIGPNIVLSSNNGAWIESKNQKDLMPPGGWSGVDPVFVGHMAKYRHLTFVRCGKSVVACSDDGWVLESLTDDR